MVRGHLNGLASEFVDWPICKGKLVWISTNTGVNSLHFRTCLRNSAKRAYEFLFILDYKKLPLYSRLFNIKQISWTKWKVSNTLKHKSQITTHTTPGRKKTKQQVYTIPVTAMVLFSDASSICQVCFAEYRAHHVSGVILSRGCSPKSTPLAGLWCCWLCSRSKAVTSTSNKYILNTL